MRHRLIALFLVVALLGGHSAFEGFAMTVHADGHCDDVICVCPSDCADHHGDHAMSAGHGAHGSGVSSSASGHRGAGHAARAAAAAGFIVATGDGDGGAVCASDGHCSMERAEATVPTPATKALLVMTVGDAAAFTARYVVRAEAPPRARAARPEAPPPRA